jgi:acyl phosphate:glycerol-3-phosphate acyltransferase
MLKGTVAVIVTRYVLGDGVAIAAAVGAFLGHLFPVWLRFRGGKGVATYIGVLLGIAWPAAIVFCVVWLAVAAATRYSSLAALTASLAAPAYLWWRGDVADARAFLLLSILLWIMHRANIERLLQGTESRIGKSAPTDAKAR